MRKKELARKITCWMTLGIFSLQPALTFAADIVADASAPEAQRPYVTETANGIPLVQIARPDGNDVSVNHYEAFSVPERGAILNNAFLFSNTQLAGYIEGNPNLSGGPARIIVNEVMSDRPSELRGYLEVAGTKADVIIANPNGIYADGAGFLNTSRAILAAGRTERDAAGGYMGLRIEDGRAYITGKGLDARGADSAEIYARAVEVNAGLWANHAKIVAGQNSIAKDGSISPITSETTSTAPQYAIDLADIGGMYANRITMVGTEKGLGVNLTGQLSATQAVSLDVNGNLKTTGSLYSDGDLSVHADRIENTNLIYGGKDTSIRAKELTNKSGGRIYGDTVTVRAESVTNETDAALEARLATEVHTLSQRAIEVEAAHRDLSTPSTSSSGFFRRRADLSKHLLAYRERIGQAESAYDAQQRVVDGIKDELSAHPAGVIAAHSQLDVSANTIQNTGNALLYSGGDIALTAEETLKNSGARIEAQGSIAITAPHIENENAAFAAKRTITSAAVNPTKIRIDEPGHIEQGKAFPEWEFRNIDSGYGAYHSHIAKKPIYEHAAYEEIKQPTPAEIAAGEAPVPAELVGTLSPNYDYDDPIFKELGVASMSTPRPAHGDPAQAAWDAKYRIVLDTLNEKIDAYNREAEEYNRTTAQAAGQKIDLLTFIETADVHSKETVTSSLSAAIRAGNSITLHGDTANTDSTISAGGTFRIDGALTENAHQQQEQTVTLGTTRGSYTKVPRFHKGRSRYYNSRVYMTPEVVRANPTSIGVSRVEENAATETIEREQRQHIANTLSPFGLASAAQTADTSAGEAPSPERISLSALYRVHPESTAKYLVETDPAFTDRKKFLSSDYMYNRLKWDPDKIPKRIGDGFYEQQLLADQILKQTGKRHLDGYTDDETAFKALMDAGITYAKEMNLSPGIKLSKEQIAALTSDMIWLEEREVYVNGKKERAVYPVLYTKNTQGLRLTKGGSLISARNIIVETKDALKNAGTLYGENILVNAGEIENTGLIRAKNIGLTSARDINVRGSVIGDKKVILDAKNNITVESTTERLAHQDVLNTTAGIAVKGDEGVLLVRAGKNIALAGATLATLGKNGSVLLSAGENISLDTKKLQSKKDMTLGAENYLRTKRSTELGTTVHADGNISLAAGNDLTARAAEISSKKGTTSLSAGNDISLTEGREISEDHYGIRYKESGLLSTKTTTIRTDTESDTAITSKVTGANVSITAKRDASFTAADIAADHDVTVTAGRNVSAASADNYVHTEHFKSVKTSGIFSAGGGLGFTIGTQQTKTTQDSDGITRQGTNIAALGGNVSISTGENAHISSSNILADKDANISAKETVIDGKSNIYRESITQESKTTGLTVSFSHGLLDLGQSLYAPISRMGEVQDDRLKAAYALQARRLIREKFGKGKNPLKGQTFSLDISFGTSKSYSRMESTTTEYAGSRIASGGNTNISAGERDLTVKGSTVIGNDVSLTAKGNVRLEAGENTSITTTENKFSSASIGASFAPSGLSNISISANKGNGNSTESVTAYSPALVSAANDLSLISGKDMDIIGSKAQGEKITAKIGGNLNVETLQEKETYEEDNHSTGFGVSWNVNQTKKETTDANGDTKIETLRSFSKPTFSGSWNKGNIDSHYRSARDQAGFFAGSKGFDIYVEKNTDLKGGVIASKASADKNRLSTGTLSFSDLHNEADYSASSFETGLTTTTKYKIENNELRPHNTLTITPIPGITISDNASTTTQSAIAPGTVIVRAGDSDALNKVLRSTENTLNALDRIFSREDVNEQKELAETFSRLLNQEIGDFSQRMQERAKAPEERKKWAEGSINITLLRALGSGIAASFGGKDALSGATGSIVHDLFAKEIAKIPDDNLQLLATAFIAGATAKLLNGDVRTSAEAAVYAVHYNAHGHRRRFDGEVVYRDGKYFRYDKASDKEDEIEKPEEGMYIWKDDEDGSGNGQDYKIVSTDVSPDGLLKIDGDYTSIELDQNGKVVFIGGNSKLREELNLHPVSSAVSSKTQPFQGKKLGFIDGYWQGVKDGGSEYVDDLKEMVQHPFDIAINLVDLIKAVKEDPNLASEIGEAKLNEWSDIVHNVVHGSQVDRGREFGHLTVDILSSIIPAGNIGKVAKLSKLAKWAPVLKKIERRAYSKEIPSLTPMEKIQKEKELLTSVGKFKDKSLEEGYLSYVARKNKQGKPPRDRIEWKDVHDYLLYDSPMARGNAFNKTAREKGWYPHNEVHLSNGKRLDSYDPVKGEIVSRKATDLEMIDVKTFERYLKELRDKYPAGTKIRSNTNRLIDGQELHGRQILEIPASNKTFDKIKEYEALAKDKYGIELRYREE